eukprot:gene49165-141_t
MVVYAPPPLAQAAGADRGGCGGGTGRMVGLCAPTPSYPAEAAPSPSRCALLWGALRAAMAFGGFGGWGPR